MVTLLRPESGRHFFWTRETHVTFLASPGVSFSGHLPQGFGRQSIAHFEAPVPHFPPPGPSAHSQTPPFLRPVRRNAWSVGHRLDVHLPSPLQGRRRWGKAFAVVLLAHPSMQVKLSDEPVRLRPGSLLARICRLPRSSLLLRGHGLCLGHNLLGVAHATCPHVNRTLLK